MSRFVGPKCRGTRRCLFIIPRFLSKIHSRWKVPSKEQVDALSADLRSRSSVPDHVYKIIDVLPVIAHPMTQFAIGVMALQVNTRISCCYLLPLCYKGSVLNKECSVSLTLSIIRCRVFP